MEEYNYLLKNFIKFGGQTMKFVEVSLVIHFDVEELKDKITCASLSEFESIFINLFMANLNAYSEKMAEIYCCLDYRKYTKKETANIILKKYGKDILSSVIFKIIDDANGIGPADRGYARCPMYLNIHGTFIKNIDSQFDKDPELKVPIIMIDDCYEKKIKKKFGNFNYQLGMFCSEFPKQSNWKFVSTLNNNNK